MPRDPWHVTLRQLLDKEPELSFGGALEPLAKLGLNVRSVCGAAEMYTGLPVEGCHPSDWRHSHPDFSPEYAQALHVCTLCDPDVFRRVSEALSMPDWTAVPPDCDGVTDDVRACLPFLKLVDAAVVSAASTWGAFMGQMSNGVCYAAREYYKEKLPPPGPAEYWCEIDPSPVSLAHALDRSNNAGEPVPCRSFFCGPRGPRTTAQTEDVQGCEGISVRKFSARPEEESEILFRPCAYFVSPSLAKCVLPVHIDPHSPAAGIPDAVHALFEDDGRTAVLRRFRKSLVAAVRWPLDKAVRARTEIYGCFRGRFPLVTSAAAMSLEPELTPIGHS